MADSGDHSTAGDAASDAPVWQTCGLHRFYVRDDVIYWECHGPMHLPDLLALFDERMALQRQHGRVLVLIDANEMTGVPAESRRYATQFKPDPPIQGTVVVFGAGLIVRTAVSLITAAARLLGRRDIRTVFFCESVEDAWAILERERLALSTGQPPT